MAVTSANPAAGDVQPCPDPSVHEHVHKLSQQASTAALYVTSADRKSDAAAKPKEDILTPEGKLSSRSAAQSLKYAKAQDLPGFPSHGHSSNAAGAAAMLAKDYRMKELWQPEMSAAGSKAAARAAKDGGKLDLWQYEGSSTGLSAAALAMKNKSTSPQIDRGYTDAGRTNSLLAATKSHQTGRQRAGSTPIRPAAPPAYPDSHNSAQNALNAATVSHRASTISANKMAPDGWDSEANQAARIKNLSGGVMDRDMFGDHPLVEPERDERRHQAALRASAVSMAKGMYEQQNRAAAQAAAAAAPAEATRDIGSAGAETAHRRNQSSISSQANIKQEAMKYLTLQDTAQRLAQERLAKVDKEFEAERYREHYGYGSTSPKRSRMSFRGRGRKRASSEGTSADPNDSSDEEQARRIRTQMSQLSTASNTVDDKQRQTDRARLLAAAEKRVHERMHTMDEQVFASTGKVSQSMMDEWEAKAREKAEQERDARASHPGQTHIGGGKYMAQADIEAIAAARLKPTLDELTDTAEKKRARDAEILRTRVAREEELAREKDRRETERMEEKLRSQEQKAEFKRIKEQDKAAARREKEERKAAARREKEEAKARKSEDKRKSRETKRDEVVAVAGGATLAEVAAKVKDDAEGKDDGEEEERDGKRDTVASAAGAATLAEIADKVKKDHEGEHGEDEDEDEEEDEEEEEEDDDDDDEVVPTRQSKRDAAAAVAGGSALAEVANRLKTQPDEQEDEEKDEEDEVPVRKNKRDAAAAVAGSSALAEIAIKLRNEPDDKEEQAGEEEKEKAEADEAPRKSKREAAAAVAGGSALAEIANKLKNEPDQDEDEDAEEDEAPTRKSKREAATAVAGGATLAEVAEKVKNDQTKDSHEDQKVEPTTATEPGTREAALAEVAEKAQTFPAEDVNEVDADETVHHQSRREKAAAVAGGATLAEVAEKVKHDRGDEEDVTDEKKEVDSGKSKRDTVAAVAGGAALAEVAEKVKNDKETPEEAPKAPAQPTPSPEKEKRKSRGVFGRISDKLRGHGDDEQPKAAAAEVPKSTEKSEKSTTDNDKHEAAETAAVGAGIVVAGAAIAGAGHAEQTVPTPAEEKEEPTLLPSGQDEKEDEDERADHVTDTLATPLFISRPDLERHISTIDTSSGESDDDDDLLDSDDEKDRRPRPLLAAAPLIAVPLGSKHEEEPPVSPLRPEERAAEPASTGAGGVLVLTEPEQPVSPVGREAEPAIMGLPSTEPGPSTTKDTVAAAPAPAVKPGPTDSDARKPRPAEEKEPKEKGKLRGFFSKLKNRDSSKPEGNKLSKSRPSKDGADVADEKTSHLNANHPTAAAAVIGTGTSAGLYEEAQTEPVASPDDSEDKSTLPQRIGTDGPIGDPAHVSGLKTSTDAAATTTDDEVHMGTDGPIGDSHHVSGLDPEHPGRPVSVSSFSRHKQTPRDLDEDDASSGAEEEDVKHGRAGRLARKLGLTKDKPSPRHATDGKAAAAPSSSAAAATTTTASTGPEHDPIARHISNVTDSNDDSEQFEEARDHFDESLAPPPAFAGQAKKDSSPVRGTRFQEQL